ncbi:3-deoxy-D-manno-octulosonic acid kinase [Algiphilus aromaticivorans]|jgi:3-deoxy-D-manno-octulosonic acid kinase|uniref:3-deoxy-D-manno-octulosonic acid kinase n=1 Tax=Algiphilus aromaticivorans TaxID=382454 RepID=UPI0006946551|nr:3-deoxy-D-manno-octulosonic acid kinase [Algiphilus aromaticivorans]
MPAAASEESGALVEQDGLAMLCDRRLIDAPGAWLFDAQGWRARGAEAHAGGRDSVLYIDDAERHWVLRFYRRGGLPGKLVEQRYVWPGLWRTRPFREYRLLERLSEEGFPVPAPVAAGVWREGAAYRGALLMQRITGVTTLGERLRAEALDASAWQRIGALIGRLHARAVHHADINVANVLLDADDDPWLVDFDRGREEAPEWLLGLGLARFRRSLRRAVNASAMCHYDDVADWQQLLQAYRVARNNG